LRKSGPAFGCFPVMADRFSRITIPAVSRFFVPSVDFLTTIDVSLVSIGFGSI
jgi:hypothetical protein